MRYLFCFIILSIATTGLWSQSPLSEKISVQFSEVYLEDALFQLLENKNIPLSFSNNIIPKDLIISINEREKTVEEILNLLFQRTILSWQLIENQIIITKTPLKERKRLTISGFLENAETGEKIMGANVFSGEFLIGTTTNEFGFYSLNLPIGTHQLIFSSLGFERQQIAIEHYTPQSLDVQLNALFLTEILVNPTKDSLFLKSPQISAHEIILDNILQFPSLGGESDVLRMIHTLSGVQTGADGFGGISVRGGNTDQNLFLLDGVPVYNGTHGLGLYSIYNSSAILKANFYKGVFPAKFGGRLSSVLDVKTKEGNRKETSIKADLGLTSLKLTWEGPIGKDEKTSFFLSGRRALFDIYSKPYTRQSRRNNGIDGFISYFFYDTNLKINRKLSKKDQVYISLYHGKDNFLDVQEEIGISNDTSIFLTDNDTIQWGNTIASLRWHRIHHDKLFSNLSLSYSQFFFESTQFVDFQINNGVSAPIRDILFIQHGSFNRDITAKLDLEYYPNENHQIDIGLQAINHKFRTSIVNFDELVEIENINLDTVGKKNTLPQNSFELDAYIQDEIRWGNSFFANIGGRLTSLLVDNKWLVSWQPRFLFNYTPSKRLTFQLAIGKHTQNLHLLSGNTFSLPEDLWVSATDLRRPQQAWQIAGGGTFQFKHGLQLGIEAYYKRMKNLVLLNDITLDRITASNWQFQVSEGSGKAYGGEVFLSRQTGKTTGWISYSLGYSNRDFDLNINEGNTFDFRLDRRHNLNIQLLHKFNKRFNLSAGWNYSTGSAYTQAVGAYFIDQTEIIYISDVPEINNQRLPPYHRLDLSVNYHFSESKLKHSLKAGVYNLYVRKNPTYRTSREIINDDGSIQTQFTQVSLLPFFPSLRYSIVF